MSEKYKNKYRIESARLQNWDYGSNAAYFVTICTNSRIHYFGNIVETQNLASRTHPNIPSQHQMELSEIGKIANQNWISIPEYFPFVKLGNHIIMPNHVHGIIIIDKPVDESIDASVGEHVDKPIETVETQNFVSLPPIPPSIPPIPPSISSIQPPSSSKNKFGPQSKNLASIIRGYKSSVKKYATINNIDFVWQPRFHDHIIRNENSFHTISQYIINNPTNWKEDQFYK